MADREKQSSAYDQRYDNDPLDEDTDEEQQEEFQFPEHGVRTAIIVGITSGLVSGLLPVIIALLAHGLHEEVGRLGDKTPYAVAQTLFLLTCLGLLLNAAVAFSAGYLTGRIAVRRMLGFYAGALVGAITLIINIIANWIPGYPPRLSSGAATTQTIQTPTGILIGTLILLAGIAIYALIGGIMGRWGAAAATNKHPYYEVGREEQ